MTDIQQLLDIERALRHALTQDEAQKESHELRTRHLTLRIVIRHCLFLLDNHLEARQAPHDFLLSRPVERAPDPAATN